MGPDDVKKMTVKQLQEALGKHKLEKKGVKAELQARLLQHLEDTSSDVDPSSVKTKAPESGEEETKTQEPDRAASSSPTADGSDKALPEAKPLKETDASAKEEPKAAPATTKSAVDLKEVKAPEVKAPINEDVKVKNDVKDEKSSTNATIESDVKDAESSTKEAAAASQVVDAATHRPRTPSTDEPVAKKQKVDETASSSGAMTATGPTTLRIDNFIRPFTLNAVKEFVQSEGAFVEGGFWINNIKTHCYVTYPTPELAALVRDKIHGVKWPELSGRQLAVDFSVHTAAEIAEQYANGNVAVAAPAASTLQRRGSKTTVATNALKPMVAAAAESAKPTHAAPKPPVAASELYFKTTTTPALYYLPILDDAELAARKETLAKNKANGVAGITAGVGRGPKRLGGTPQAKANSTTIPDDAPPPRRRRARGGKKRRRR
ncbi:Aste57867_10719 [Aphanomyces stellatus]|uniref:Aste57867_10719 protein n=1 Tax=Aphanomyces stellatus TaxID=120398 RepID=A0A485KRM7_9STRA|nr:hypothetical protein As57867_010679 [Aphanomyces stellatus]VFT87589.1 Aste57867_10719 [Aphanomyces stellatus]